MSGEALLEMIVFADSRIRVVFGEDYPSRRQNFRYDGLRSGLPDLRVRLCLLSGLELLRALCLVVP